MTEAITTFDASSMLMVVGTLLGIAFIVMVGYTIYEMFGKR